MLPSVETCIALLDRGTVGGLFEEAALPCHEENQTLGPCLLVDSRDKYPKCHYKTVFVPGWGLIHSDKEGESFRGKTWHTIAFASRGQEEWDQASSTELGSSGISHLCNNTRCCNPLHLCHEVLGTWVPGGPLGGNFQRFVCHHQPMTSTTVWVNGLAQTSYQRPFCPHQPRCLLAWTNRSLGAPVAMEAFELHAAFVDQLH